MSSATDPYFISYSVGAALVAHSLLRKYVLRCACAALLGNISFLGVACSHEGYLDPFCPYSFWSASQSPWLCDICNRAKLATEVLSEGPGQHPRARLPYGALAHRNPTE
jgi:hypothetical protein